jgi:Tudor domain
MIIFWDSPFEFFVRPHNQRSTFDHFKCRLNKIYNEAEPSTSTFDVNDCVVVRIENDFLRGLVLGMSQYSQYYVQLVDIGQKITCDKTALYNILREEIFEPSFFAIRCSLYRVVPAFESTIEEKKMKCVADLLNRENLFPCKFLGMAKQRYMVKLKLDNSDLKTQLIEKNMVSNLPKSE